MDTKLDIIVKVEMKIEEAIPVYEFDIIDKEETFVVQELKLLKHKKINLEVAKTIA